MLNKVIKIKNLQGETYEVKLWIIVVFTVIGALLGLSSWLGLLDIPSSYLIFSSSFISLTLYGYLIPFIGLGFLYWGSRLWESTMGCLFFLFFFIIVPVAALCFAVIGTIKIIGRDFDDSSDDDYKHRRRYSNGSPDLDKWGGIHPHDPYY